jgi:hypothetical protein
VTEKIELRKKALRAYETSSLKQDDLQKSVGEIKTIQEFLVSVCGITITVDSNPFEIDGIRFNAEAAEDNDGIYAYDLEASRKCARCNAYLTLDVGRDHLDEAEFTIRKTFSLALLGQWLSEDHKCDFKTRVEGFMGKAQE